MSHRDILAIDNHGIVSVGDSALEPAVDGVVLHHVLKRIGDC